MERPAVGAGLLAEVIVLDITERPETPVLAAKVRLFWTAEAYSLSATMRVIVMLIEP